MRKEICPTCIFYEELPDVDVCHYEISDADVVTDEDGLIVSCRRYCQLPTEEERQTETSTPVNG